MEEGQTVEIQETREPLREQGSIRALLELLEQQGMEQEKRDVLCMADYIDSMEMIALPLHIGAQGLERVFLNRIADLPEKKTQANGQITEEEDQNRQVADQSAPASVFQNKPSPHDDMCRTFLIRIVNIIPYISAHGNRDYRKDHRIIYRIPVSVGEGEEKRKR